MTPQDKELLAKKGISEAQIAEQLACFQKGFPFLKLDAAASVEKGILAPDADEQGAYLAAWDAYKNTEKTIVKFVPASGAASRMFKNLFEFLGADYDQPTTKFEQAFFESIEKFECSLSAYSRKGYLRINSRRKLQSSGICPARRSRIELRCFA